MTPLRATYRLQFGPRFGFREATAAAPYLARLGISHVYASPLLKPRPGSTHGYDIVDPSRLNPELGSRGDFEDFLQALREHGLGLILDVVPNHLCASAPENRWWADVLQFGIASPYVPYFDIDFRPAKPDLRNRLLLPMLGSPYGRALEAGDIALAFEDGEPVVRIAGQRLPLTPCSWPPLLRPLLRAAEWSSPLQDLSNALDALPLPDEPSSDGEYRRRVLEQVARFHSLVARHRDLAVALKEELAAWNGRPGTPGSFDRLDELLERQVYRLSSWRVASDEINYRRFFDVNELVAIHAEEPEVFDALHALPLALIERGVVDGLRIDHVDGLSFPAQYLQTLERHCAARRPDLQGPFPLFVEKILGHQERLDERWPVRGTTGYEFLNLANGLFIEPVGFERLRSFYESFARPGDAPGDGVYHAKKLILLTSLAGELQMLALRLDRISERHRSTRDFTRNSLERAVREVIACFPVYRSYISAPSEELRPADRETIQSAIATAKWRNRSTSASLFDFLQSVLLLEPGPADDRHERFEFVRRFQQLSGPVMAKGLEDTAFYRYVPLASMNEVGGDPARGLSSLDEFHQENRSRLRAWPDSLLASTTHDTKRSEDARARLNVLAELPGRWETLVLRWAALNRPLKRTVDGRSAPDRNEEYLLYQTLLATLPTDAAPGPEYRDRICAYFEKALREAKVHTSWISPYSLYEQGCRGFIEALLDPAHPFLAELSAFVREIEPLALQKSLAQLLLKMTAPGVPDFYQGSEQMDYRLADPDNRSPVDLARRAAALDRLDELPASAMPEGSDALKLWSLRRVLAFRRRRPELFARGAYLPLRATAPHDLQVVAFARSRPGELALAASIRFGAPRISEGLLLLPPELGAERYRDLLRGRVLELRHVDGKRGLALGELFESLPIALLEAAD